MDHTLLAMMGATIFAGSLSNPHRPMTHEEALDEAARLFKLAEEKMQPPVEPADEDGK